jgi:sugar lactone lactonase YvrE
MGNRQDRRKVIAITLVILVLVGCSATASRSQYQEAPTAITQEQPPPLPSTATHTPEQPTPLPPITTYTPEQPTPTSFEFLSAEPLTERPRYVWLEQKGIYADYLHRQFLQNSQEAAWSPDEYLYVADGSGKHIVRIAPDGTMDDLGLWKNHIYMQEYGPNAIEFDRDGNLFFNTGPHLFRLNTDGSIEWIFTAEQGNIRSLTMDETGVLFYSLNTGPIYQWNPDGEDILLADEYHDPQILIGPEGQLLYISDYGMNRVVVLDVNSREARIFAEGYFGREGCYMRFDPEGDLWTRGTTFAYQFSPDGEIKPFTIDGRPGSDFRWHLAGDIEFDDNGNLWVTYGSGEVVRLAPVDPESSDSDFTSELIYDSFEASEVAVGPQGEVYATDLVPGSVWRFTPDGSYEIIWEHGDQGRVGIAVNDQGAIYAGSIFGEILKLENGEISHYADLVTERMIIAGDGNLYAAVGGDGSGYRVVRITGVDTYETFASEIAGVPLGDAPVQLAPAMDHGLYVLAQSNGTLFYINFEGEGKVVARLSESMEFAVMASSPVTDIIYFLAHVVNDQGPECRPYALCQYDPGGQLEVVSPVVPGDPWGMDVSPDGKWLYIVEVGAIDKVPLGEP